MTTDRSIFQLASDLTVCIDNKNEDTSVTFFKGEGENSVGIRMSLDFWSKFREQFEVIDHEFQRRRYIYFKEEPKIADSTR